MSLCHQQCLWFSMNSDGLTVLNWKVRGLNDAAHREIVRETVICSIEAKFSVPAGDQTEFPH